MLNVLATFLKKKRRSEQRMQCVETRTITQLMLIYPTGDMLLVKILFNSIISNKGETFITTDIRHVYLVMPLKR